MSQPGALGRQILDLTVVLVPVSSEKPPHVHLRLTCSLRVLKPPPRILGAEWAGPTRSDRTGCALVPAAHLRGAGLSINARCCCHNMEGRRAAAHYPNKEETLTCVMHQ